MEEAKKRKKMEEAKKIKVFISWSGDTSRKVAEVFDTFIPEVISGTKCWLSSKDIEKGSPWDSSLSEALRTSDYCIICITHDNHDKPWPNFEAGAIANKFDMDRVAPFAFCIPPNQIAQPLRLFQSTVYKKSDIRRLFHSIYQIQKQQVTSSEKIDEQFRKLWPKMEQRIEDILRENATHAGAVCFRRRGDKIEYLLIHSRGKKTKKNK